MNKTSANVANRIKSQGQGGYDEDHERGRDRDTRVRRDLIREVKMVMDFIEAMLETQQEKFSLCTVKTPLVTFCLSQ